jgi:hypothetical protein
MSRSLAHPDSAAFEPVLAPAMPLFASKQEKHEKLK